MSLYHSKFVNNPFPTPTVIANLDENIIRVTNLIR